MLAYAKITHNKSENISISRFSFFFNFVQSSEVKYSWDLNKRGVQNKWRGWSRTSEKSSLRPVIVANLMLKMLLGGELS